MENSTVRDTASNTVLTFDQFLVGMLSCSIMYVLVSTFGILTNIINIRTFVTMGLRDAMTVSFLFLSVTDFMLSFVSLATGVGGILYVSEFMFGKLFSIEPNIIGVFSTNLFIPLSAVVALNTSFISVARCVCISLPFYFKNMFNRNTAVIFMSVSFLFSTVLYIPVFKYMGVIDKFDPVLNRSRPSVWVSPDRKSVKDIVWNILGTAIPFSTQAIIIISTIILARALTKSQKFRSANTQSFSSSDEWKDKNSNISSGKLAGKDQNVVKQVVVISLIFIACNTPKIFFILAGVIFPELTLGGRLTNLYMTVSNVCMLLEITNSAVSLPIYYTHNSKFRKLCRF